MLAGCGWDGHAAVFAMRKEVVKPFAHGLRLMFDDVSARWPEREPGSEPARIYVVARGGSLLLNLHPERGLYLEPGSTNRGAA